jgi:hypothetical protein
MPALEGPVLFRTIAVLEPAILCFRRRPNPIGFVRRRFRALPSRLRGDLVREGMVFEFGFAAGQ